jgi:NAD(P)H-hydrate epimerase
MKVVTAQTMTEIETLAYQAGFHAQDFMENAGRGIAGAVEHFIDACCLQKSILLLCGKGNNAGDAFVAGCYLLQKGYLVHAVQPSSLERSSALCQTNAKLFLAQGGKLIDLEHIDFVSYSVLLDGIFGTGFKGEVKTPYAQLIQAANNSSRPILAIDIPSGLNGSTGETSQVVIQATATLFLGLPKMGFFLLNGWQTVGQLQHVDFGLPAQFSEEAPSLCQLSTVQSAAALLPAICRTRHKYQAGQVVGLAGSPGMPGAALLSSLAALRGGCGMMRLIHPPEMQYELANSPYELIKVASESPSDILNWLKKGKANFVGPGLGCTDKVRQLLHVIIPQLPPCVIDADALTLFAEEAFTLPKQAILTPHTGEMQRLLHSKDPLILNEETLNRCQQYAEKQNVVLILKGAPTFIFAPQEPIHINPTGDPGMATAGSGDVLTGLLAALLAQGLSCHQAAILGTYLHGLSGQFAAQRRTSYSLIATDLIEHFSEAYQYLLDSQLSL